MSKISKYLFVVICFFTVFTVLLAEEVNDDSFINSEEINTVVEEGEEPVIPPAVISLLKPTVIVKAQSYNSLLLEINHNDSNAIAYQIYRATSKNGKYTKIATIKVTPEEIATIKSYVNTKLTFNKTYYYKVRSYAVVDGKTKYSAYSSIVSKKVVPSKVNASGVSSTYLKNKITWGKVSGASGYQIYKLVSGKYVLLKDTTSLTYTDTLKNTANKPQNVNLYKVRAYKKSGKTKIYGAYSNIITVTSELQIPSLKYNSRDIKLFNITNSSVEGANGYEVHECILDECTLLFSGSSINENIVTASMAETHTYKIRAYRNLTDENRLYSEFSELVTYNSIPAPLNINDNNNFQYGVAGKNSVYINFINRTGYENVSFEVYSSTSKTGTYSLDETIECIISDEYYGCYSNEVELNKTYYYKVVTIVNEDGVDYRSNYTDVFSITVIPGKVTDLIKSPYTYNSTALFWEGEDWYDGYEIYRATTKTGKYTKLKTTTDDFIIDTGLKIGNTYYYKVRPYAIDKNGKKIYGAFSSIISRKVVPLTSFNTYPVELTNSTSSSIIKSASFTKSSVIGSSVVYKFKINFSKTYSSYKQTVYYAIYFYNFIGEYVSTSYVYINLPSGTKKNYSITKEIKVPKDAVYWEFY